MWYYFGTFGGSKIAKTCPSTYIAPSNSEFRSATESKQQQKEGPAWKVHSWIESYDWKENCWAWCCNQLVHPRPLYTGGNLVPHSFHFKIRGHCSMCAQGVRFIPDPTTLFLPRITTNPSIHKKFTPPPPPKNTRSMIPQGNAFLLSSLTRFCCSSSEVLKLSFQRSCSVKGFSRRD